MRTPDRRWELNPYAMVQLTHVTSGHGSHIDSTGFNLHSAKFILHGHIYDPSLTYHFQLNAGEGRVVAEDLVSPVAPDPVVRGARRPERGHLQSPAHHARGLPGAGRALVGGRALQPPARHRHRALLLRSRQEVRGDGRPLERRASEQSQRRHRLPRDAAARLQPARADCISRSRSRRQQDAEDLLRGRRRLQPRAARGGGGARDEGDHPPSHRAGRRRSDAALPRALAARTSCTCVARRPTTVRTSGIPAASCSSATSSCLDTSSSSVGSAASRAP